MKIYAVDSLEIVRDAVGVDQKGAAGDTGTKRATGHLDRRSASCGEAKWRLKAAVEGKYRGTGTTGFAFDRCP
jgi:hypothetical protein